MCRNTGAVVARPPPLPNRANTKGRERMTEPAEQEPTEPTVADVPEPDQEPREPIPDEADTKPQEPAQEPAQASQPPVDAAKEQRRMAAALKREKEAHDRKLEKILGPAHEHVLPCPLCGDGMQGYVFPGDGQMLDEETKSLALAFLGEAGPAEMREAEGAEMCDRCDGIGQLKWPTRNPHMTTQTCPKCSGNGYVLVQPQQSNVSQLPSTTYTPPPANYGEVGPCPLCGAPNSAGKPHFCNPQTTAGASGV